jgi:hypothetical protein
MANQLYRILILSAAAVLTACGGSGGGTAGGPGGPGGPGPSLGLVATPKTMLTIDRKLSCDAVQSYVVDSIADLVLNVGVISCPGCDVAVAGSRSVEQAAPGAAPPSFDAFSGTNNQETGVDELDQIEADQNGNFYMIDGGHLVVANGLPPANLRQIASLEIDSDRRAEGLVLDPVNRRLVIVLSRSFFFGGPVPLSIVAPVPWEPVTELLFVDVADPSNPVIDGRLKIEGFRLSVRRIDNRVHVVSHWTPIIPIAIWDDASLIDLRRQLSAATSDSDSISDDIRSRVATLVSAIDVKDFLPDLTQDSGSGVLVDITTADCSDVAIPDVTMPFALTSITSVDSDGTNVDALKVVNNSWNVYTSSDNIFLSQTSGAWWFAAPERQRQQTAIYKIGIGAGAPTYKATGLIEGWADSTFQYSEHEGFLRVVTNRWERDPSLDTWFQDNNLFVLEDNAAGSLETVGKVTGFGEQERIFSARFLGDRGFVVTFRQIDPLFTFDLSDPRNPRLAGEVEIPGVSTYIHPLDQSHLLTIGFAGDENRLNGDFQLQIFDVQNLDDPRLIHKFVPLFGEPGFSWTPATYDHLAFNYFPEAGTLTVPVQYYANDMNKHFSGFIAFSVDVAAGIAELGRLDHSDLARQKHCVSATGAIPAFCFDGRYLEAADPRRSVSALFSGETYDPPPRIRTRG